MSRIGRRPVVIPDKVQFAVDGIVVSAEGPLGKLSTTLPKGVSVTVADGKAQVIAPPKKNRENTGYLGLARALVANMVEGVTKGFEKDLEISGVGYRAEPKGRQVVFSLGYSHTITLDLPEGITAEIDKQQTKVKIKGIDKQLVGQVAAQIRSYKIPEPYKAKGVKYATETIKRKVGKAGAK